MIAKYLSYVALFLHTLASASQSEANGVVTIGDRLSADEYEHFSKLVTAKKITKVIFKNCLGGTELVAFRYAEKFMQYKIPTVASGLVASGCAFAYLGGSNRMLDEAANVNVLMFHGGFDRTTLKPRSRLQNQEFLDIFEKHIGFKFGSSLEDILLNTKKVDEGIYFIDIRSSAVVKRFTYYCEGSDASSFDKCQDLRGITLESEGITTQ